jgi:DNA-binding CsgD family transcriptional regulator
MRTTLVSKIELLIRSRLVKDLLSPVLMNAGFTIFHAPLQPDTETVVIADIEDCNDPERVNIHRSHGVKIVGLASIPEIGIEDIAPLSGILTDDLSADAFVQSLRLICSGERVFPRKLAPAGSSPTPSPDIEARSDGVRLSPREKEVLLYLTDGHSNKAIAQHLNMAEATVKVHIKNMLRKINADNRTQAAIWALANLPELVNYPARSRLNDASRAFDDLG